MPYEPFTFTFVLERLVDFTTNQIRNLSIDEVEEIGNLQRQVEIAQGHLKNVDEVQRQAKLKHELKTNVQHVMDILCEIEDFIDSQKWKSGAVWALKRKRFAHKAKKLAQKLSDVVECLKGFDLKHHDAIPMPLRNPTQPDNFKEELLVGLVEDVEAYAAELVPTKANHGSCTDLAIFGMGGSGKTTTAKLLYKQISEHFDRRAWVCVSQQWDKTQLLLQICHQVGVPRSYDDERLLLNLNEFLHDHSCFFVLDDVWEVKALRELLNGLRSRSGYNGGKAASRVLVTTRNREIFDFPQNDFSIKKIRSLTHDESRDLLLKTIRRNRRDGWNLEGEFEKLGKEMLDKCKGLPLAIVALGGILSSKDTVPEWERVKVNVVRRISSHVGADDDYGVVKEILELSYIDLPYCLKHCFMYLGIFPEDAKIDVHRLINLWIAEGFVKVDQNSCSNTLETLARDYLDELAHRCMVEVDEKDYGGVISSIRIHDLMRELCIQKAEDQKFFEFLPPPTSTSTFVNQNSCRVILHEEPIDIDDCYNSFAGRRKVRTYIMLKHFTSRSSLSLTGMKYLRVLCLFDIELKDTSEAKIGDLVLLRHLELNSCKLSRGHTTSIKKLRNLLSFTWKWESATVLKVDEITDWESDIVLGADEVPASVGGMHHLRHLHVSDVEVRDLRLENKYNLHTLDVKGGEWLAKELSHANLGLQELRVADIGSSVQLEGVHEFFSNPAGEHLHTLHLGLEQGNMEFDLGKFEPLGHCANLQLLGKIRTQPHQPFGRFPRRLLKLVLNGSRIGEAEHFRDALAQLDELRYLHLTWYAYTGDILTMSGLPKLQELYLGRLFNLKEWRVESRALCRLQELEISYCSHLERLPQQISCISTLKHLQISGMPQIFASRLQQPSENGAEGEDFHLVTHIPSVKFRGCY